MIGKLSGIIDSFDANHFILDVSGVGYLLQASGRTLSSVGGVGDVASLFVITHVREDAITLYGFSDIAEKEWFVLLTSVQGVGAKAALSILSACSADQIGFIIASQDKAALTRADGVGPKLATRILTELKDKAAKFELSSVSSLKPQLHADGAVHQTAGDVDTDAVSALTNLGYASSDAYRAVMAAQAKANDNYDLQTLIRLALQELSA